MSDQLEGQLWILEAAATAKARSRDFDVLLSNLGLPLSSRAELVRVIRAGEWRGKRRPFVWLKRILLAESTSEPKCSAREPERVTVEPRRGQDFSDALSELDATDYGDGGDPFMVDRVDPRFVIEEAPPADVAEWCLDPIRKLNFDAIAEATRLDVWEVAAFRHMAQGTGLKAALSSVRYRGSASPSSGMDAPRSSQE